MTERYKCILLGFFTWLILGVSIAQTPVDYAAKALKKEIEKNWGSNINDLIPLDIDSGIPLNGRFFISVGPHTKYVYVGRVNSCRTGGCSIDNETYGNSEYFDYFILFDSLANVELVRIFNYAATHGHEVMAKGWLKQFVNYNDKTELAVGKEVDTISGATISVNAITEDIRERTNLLGKYLNSKVLSEK